MGRNRWLCLVLVRVGPDRGLQCRAVSGSDGSVGLHAGWASWYWAVSEPNGVIKND